MAFQRISGSLALTGPPDIPHQKRIENLEARPRTPGIDILEPA